MDLRVCNVPITDTSSTITQPFESFVSKSTTTVEDVIKKGRSFGFRDVDVHFGSKKITPEKAAKNDIYTLDGKSFCFTALKENTLKGNTTAKT